MVHKMEWYVGTEWENVGKGLHKRVLDLEFTKVDKPLQIAKVVIHVEKVENLTGRETKYLKDNYLNTDQTMEIGTALTPVDCYLEMFVQQMMVGEKSECTIKTQKSEDIKIVLYLKDIQHSHQIQKLTASEMYDLALKYKENGVHMFKTYPLFAHEYFVKAAKCLISCKKFEVLTTKDDGVAGKDMQDLFVQIQSNLAASLLIEQRFEDVLYLTKFVDTMNSAPEKGIYRRAMAYYHIKEYELAQQTIEKVANYKEKKEFANLYQKVKSSLKNSNEQYKGMVQKMFG